MQYSSLCNLIPLARGGVIQEFGLDIPAKLTPNLTSYKYGFNNPIRFFDKFGLYEDERDDIVIVDNNGKELYRSKDEGSTVDLVSHLDENGDLAYLEFVGKGNTKEVSDDSDDDFGEWFHDNIWADQAMEGAYDGVNSGQPWKEGKETMLNTLGIILTGGSMSISGVTGIGIAGIANSSDNILGLSNGIENDGIKFGVDVVKTGIDAANFVTDFEFTNELPYGIEFANELQYGVVPLDGFNVTFDLIDLYEQYKNWK
jgi:hypothetical protein